MPTPDNEHMTSSSENTISAIQQPKFLYVEDDMLSRRVMSMLLSKIMKFDNVTIFDNSSDFMERIQNLPEKPNIIFLDVQIGPYDGYQMLSMLQDSGDFKDAIIIAMTANVMSHDVEKLRKAGFTGLIGKPIIKEIFPSLVEKILKGETIWYVP